jgi:hypothetical protein
MSGYLMFVVDYKTSDLILHTFDVSYQPHHRSVGLYFKADPWEALPTNLYRL